MEHTELQGGPPPAAPDPATERLPAVPPGDDELDEDWDDNGVGGGMGHVARRSRRARLLTAALALVAAAGLGFLGGVLYQKDAGAPATGSAASPFAGLGSGGFRLGSGGFGGFGGTASSTSVTGEVSVVDGDTLYVSQGSGALTKVVTTPQSSVSVPSSGSVGDVRPGDQITVSGARQADGSFAAATIQDTGSSSSTGSTAAPAAGG